MEQTNTSDKGLTWAEAEERLRIEGENVIPQPPQKSKWKILFNQFNDLLIYILIFAALVTLGLSLIKSKGIYSLEYFFDTVVIVIVLIINAALGFYQEWKAEKAVNSLRSLISDETTVIREGSPSVINSEKLVVGDIVEIMTGEKLSADIRIISSNNLLVNESALTGESIPINKISDQILASSPLAERKNMAYMGTFVEKGKATGVVVATGKQTEVGKISEMVSSIDSFKTPLQEKLEAFSSLLAKIIIAIAVVLISFGVIVEFFVNRGRIEGLEAVLDLTIVGISLAVAAIPEGLPIILTFTLALSVQKLAKRNSIIRNLQAVETIGSVTTIATDKTGTLTMNKLKLVGYHTLHSSHEVGENPVAEEFDIMHKVLKVAVSPFTGRDSGYLDPLDKAIIEEIGIEEGELTKEFPFDSGRKMMSVLSRNFLAVKGAPDILIQQSRFLHSDKVEQIDSTTRIALEQKLEDLTSEGYRVIGVAYRHVDEDYGENAEDYEKDLVFVGFLTFIDPPRPEVFEALSNCFSAGINVVMITGDHPNTAYTIAKELGIVSSDNPEDFVLTGNDLDTLEDRDLIKILDKIKVFARVSPEHKLRLVSLYKEKGEIVAMTGDGVNDSPALVMADIGVAMGISGTDAAKESSDMILLDDNFATLVEAVEEGRKVNTNIRKFTNYLLASNTSEVLIILLAFIAIATINPIMLRELIPLTETQILYLNLVTDSFLALALGLEVRETGIMKNPPRDPESPIVNGKDIRRILWMGGLVAVVDIIVFLMLLGPIAGWENLTHEQVAYSQAYTLTLLVILEVFIAVSYRSHEFIWKMNIWSNNLFGISILLVIVAQLAILYIPLMNILFDTRPLGLMDWVEIMIISIIVLLIFELSKVKFKLNVKKIHGSETGNS